MIAEIRSHAIERFRAAIAGRLGLYFDEGKSGFLAEVLRGRVEANGQDLDAYLVRLESGREREEVRALARELTVPETYFFRNIDQYRALSEIVLPERLAARSGERCLRILSLGCASGEEAYSLAILIRSALADSSWDLSILGVDVNSAMIEKARRGRFTSWALRETPEADRRRWFRVDGRDFILDETVRTSVRFEEGNLVDDAPQLWQNGTYDVIFFRNVVMYFTPDQAQTLIGRITRALCPGGYLFLGHAETLRGLSNDFHLRHTHGTFYYQRREAAEHLSSSSSPRSELRHVPVASLTADAADTTTWVDTICRASERVVALTESRRADCSPSKAFPAAPARDLGLVFELLRKERFTEALAIVDALPPESSCEADVLLLRGVLLTHGGQLGGAEATCSRLLELDDLNAGAHYLLALCSEGSGDRAAASYHDQVAAYLDPGFSMPRLHLGLLARRAGDYAAARRELGQALVLLQREDPSRLLLFGGGFGRETLVALCRAELLQCGGRP